MDALSPTMLEGSILRRVRAARVQLRGAQTWTLVVDQRPCRPVEAYLSVERDLGASANTIHSYALHLALYFRWLLLNGLEWDEIEFRHLANFQADLTGRRLVLSERERDEPRSKASVRAIRAAVVSFYEFHAANGAGPKNLQLRLPGRGRQRGGHRGFLFHIDQRDPQLVSRLRSHADASRAKLPAVISSTEDLPKLFDACLTDRDKLLLSLLADLGLRIGQALGARHEDMDVVRRRVRVVRREDNPNNALSKQRETFFVDAPARTFDLYAAYVLNECVPRGIESDFVLVNLTGPVGSPMRYRSTKALIERLSRRAGVPIEGPHTLRHTHGTDLAMAGWTNAEIAERLGQSNPTSADVYIHLAEHHMRRRFQETEHLLFPRPAEQVQ